MSQPELSFTEKPLPQKRATSFQIIKAISWGFLGMRKLKSYEDVTPMQVWIGGLIGVAMFIATMLVLVNLAIKYLS